MISFCNKIFFHPIPIKIWYKFLDETIKLSVKRRFEGVGKENKNQTYYKIVWRGIRFKNIIRWDYRVTEKTVLFINRIKFMKDACREARCVGTLWCYLMIYMFLIYTMRSSSSRFILLRISDSICYDYESNHQGMF